MYVSPITTVKVTHGLAVQMTPKVVAMGVGESRTFVTQWTPVVTPTLQVTAGNPVEVDSSHLISRASGNERWDIISAMAAYGAATLGAIAELALLAQDFETYELLMRFAESENLAPYIPPPQQVAEEGSYVGALKEQWQFPSDHLPIGATVDGFGVASFNVLNNRYFSWVTEKDSQGLNGSLLTDLQYPVNEQGLMARDQKVVDLIVEGMLSNQENRRAVVALQECSPEFIEELTRRLPENYALISTSQRYFPNQHLFLIDKERFAIQDTRSSSPYQSTPKKLLLEVTLRDKVTGREYQFFNAHLPGDPEGRGIKELSDYLNGARLNAGTTLLLGDMNFTQEEMKKYLQLNQEYTFYSPDYCTNVSPRSAPDYLCSKTIDHIIELGNSDAKITMDGADQVLPELQQTTDLLKASQQALQEGAVRRWANPPSMRKSVPVIKLDTSRDKNKISSATSSLFP